MVADEIVVAGFHELRRRLATRGVTVRVVSGWRSAEEQRRLFHSGQGDAAPPGRSYHESGFALDIVPDPQSPEVWNLLGMEAEKIGFRWGGRFRRSEPWHIDAGRFLSLRIARAWYGRGEFLKEV